MSAIVNVEQAAAWNGPEGDYWAEYAERFDRTNHRHRAHLLAAGLVSPGADVLDIGCGAGRLTRDVARLARPGAVLGVDLSARMLARARGAAVAEGLDNVRFELGDAQVHPFGAARFDAAVSSFGVMFFNDPVAAFTNIATALRPGARIGALVWRDLARNEWMVAIRAALASERELPEPPPDAPGPFALADGDRVRGILQRAGFDEIGLRALDEPLDFGACADDAYDFISGLGPVQGAVEDLGEAARRRVLDRLRAVIAEHETGDGVQFGSSAWLITGRRRAPAD